MFYYFCIIIEEPDNSYTEDDTKNIIIQRTNSTEENKICKRKLVLLG